MYVGTESKSYVVTVIVLVTSTSFFAEYFCALGLAPDATSVCVTTSKWYFSRSTRGLNLFPPSMSMASPSLIPPISEISGTKSVVTVVDTPRAFVFGSARILPDESVELLEMLRGCDGLEKLSLFLAAAVAVLNETVEIGEASGESQWEGLGVEFAVPPSRSAAVQPDTRRSRRVERPVPWSPSIISLHLEVSIFHHNMPTCAETQVACASKNCNTWIWPANRFQWCGQEAPW